MVRPTLRLERSLFRAGYLLVAGVDEVGRGALAGPVSVGVVLVDGSVRSATPGLRDSKLLTPRAREELLPKLGRWPLAWAVGHAEAAEIDEFGIIAGMRLAAGRAFAQLPARPDVAILDGPHNYLRDPGSVDDSQLSLFDVPGPAGDGLVDHRPPVVITKIKADLTCSTVAAASVLAKVTRDRLMVARARSAPGYQWQENKGYASAEHVAALRSLGPSLQHRRSWRLPCSGVARPLQLDGIELAVLAGPFAASEPDACAGLAFGDAEQPQGLSTIA